jgi:malate synthase
LSTVLEPQPRAAASARIQAAPSRIAGADAILTPGALEFLAELHDLFNGRRLELLERRIERQARFDAGELPEFPDDTRHIRESDWTVAPAPADLQDRRVEITGPTNAKMLINALNSGARVFMADFEDATAPAWDELVQGQVNLCNRWLGTLDFTDATTA